MSQVSIIDKDGTIESTKNGCMEMLNNTCKPIILTIKMGCKYKYSLVSIEY